MKLVLLLSIAAPAQDLDGSKNFTTDTTPLGAPFWPGSNAVAAGAGAELFERYARAERAHRKSGGLVLKPTEDWQLTLGVQRSLAGRNIEQYTSFTVGTSVNF